MSNSCCHDLHGRSLGYLRLSVTDRCNLACAYCVNSERQRFIPHENILRYEEMYRLAAIFSDLGVKKTRITGGEPLARRGIVDFLAGFRRQFPDMRLCMTTNALLLPDCLDELARLGLYSFNISLDSFNARTYEQITGKNALGIVTKAIEDLLARGQRVKINAVAMRGITDKQMNDFIHAARHMPIDLRFIEYMPMGANTAWDHAKFISVSELRQIISQMAEIVPVQEDDAFAGPARIYKIRGGKGRLGFISAISDHFCNICQRARVTSEGNLRLCLFSDRETRLAPLLRNHDISDEDIKKVICDEFQKKPMGAARLAARGSAAVALRQMVGIGG